VGFLVGAHVRFPGRAAHRGGTAGLLESPSRVRPTAPRALASAKVARAMGGCIKSRRGWEPIRSSQRIQIRAGDWRCNGRSWCDSRPSCSVIHQALARSTQAIHSIARGRGQGRVRPEAAFAGQAPDPAPVSAIPLLSALRRQGFSAFLPEPGPLATEAARKAVRCQSRWPSTNFPPHQTPCGKDWAITHVSLPVPGGEASPPRPQPTSQGAENQVPSPRAHAAGENQWNQII